MKRLLPVLVLPVLLLAGCSGSGTPEAGPTAQPSASLPASASAAATATPTAGATPTRAPVPKPAPVGPVGTKVPAGFAPSSATFVSDRTGWVLGAAPCPGGKGNCDVIARTRDGGATWRAIPSPATSPERLAQIRFADERNGFVTGDQLWATHDGGASWKVVPGVGPVLSLATAAGRVWYAQDARLLSAPAAGGAFVTERTGGHVQAFTLQGKDAVYTVGEHAVAYRIRHGADPVARTLPCVSGETPVVALGSVTRWLLVCEGDAAAGRQDKRAFRSEDGGASWQPAGEPPPVIGTDAYVTTAGDVVIDHQQVAIYREGEWEASLTTDGGLSEGGFVSARLGFCIGSFDGSPQVRMKVTRDTGRTWTTVVFPAGSGR